MIGGSLGTTISKRPASRSARKVPRLRFTEGRSGFRPRCIFIVLKF
jgi:hypothetical protein